MSSLAGKIIPSDPGIIFMGTPEFALPSLHALIRSKYRILGVVTQPDRPKGRGRKLTPPPVKILAMENSIEVYQPIKASENSFMDLLRSKEPDLMVVVAYGQILSREFLDIPTYGVINVHASLLPKYRGAAPIQWAILNNEKVTGLTIMRMDEGLDTGPILYQKPVPIGEEETAGELHGRMAELAGEFLIESLEKMKLNEIREVPQDQSKASYAPKIERDMCNISWKSSSLQISSLIRALDPWPGAHTSLKEKTIKIFRPKIIETSKENTLPGRVINARGTLEVETGDGIIEIREIQAPGKKRMKIQEFLRGAPIEKGTVLGRY